MSVPTQEIIINYKSNGENIFVIPFDFLEDEQIKVFVTAPNSKDKAEQIFGKDFNIDDNSVVFVEPVPEKSIVTIQRSTDIDNDLNLLNNTKLPANVLNHAFDKLTMICQELQEQLSHTLIYDGDDSIDIADLIQNLVDIKNYMCNANELSTATLKAAVSAAQALASALRAQSFCNKAEKYAANVQSNSNISIHNNYESAHPFIRKLITDHIAEYNQHIEKYNAHIEAYDKHIEDNTKEHQDFVGDIAALESDVQILKNTSGIALDNNGTYNVFGTNDKGQLGMNWTTDITLSPIEHFAMRNVTAVSISTVCGTAIAGGRIYVTGNGSNGLCGPDRQACYGFKVHPSVDNIYNFIDIACFEETAFALDSNGKLYSWGNGGLHCLGDGTTIDRSVPRHIMPDIKFKKICSGCRVMLALSEDGKIYTCGSSSYGALGHGITSESSALLKEISNLGNIIDISAGGFVSDSKYLNFCAAIQQNEGERAKLYTWGYNGYGQLGLGNTTSVSAPQLVEIDFEPTKISAGSAHLAVLSADGQIYIVGAKAALQSSANQTTLKLIETDDIYTDIATGRDVTYMLTSNKYIYGIGAAKNGSLLGQKSTASPVKLVEGNIKAIYSGCQHYGCAFTVAEGTDND